MATWTKRQLLDGSYNRLAMAGYVFDLEPEDIIMALVEMDAMLAEWDAKGVRISYNMGNGPEDSDPDQESGIPAWAATAIMSNLAIRLSPSFGKEPSQALKGMAKSSYSSLLTKVVRPIEWIPDRRLPAGAGNKHAFRTFMPQPQGITTDQDDILEI
jgi:hypothetical protein